MIMNIRPTGSPRHRIPPSHGGSWSRRPTVGSADLTFGRFRVLLRRRQLLADGVPVELGTRAFDVLLVLLDADGALVTKQELLSRVWPGVAVAEENLKFQVSALRKALGADRDVIHTEFGRGYRFTGVLGSNAATEPAALCDQSRRLPEFCFHGAVGLRFSAVSIDRALSVTVFRSPHNEETDRMTVKLNGPGYKHAKRLIEDGKFIDDEREAWSDHHPSTQTEKDFIEKHGFSEYSKWFLVANDEYREDSRRHYEFPVGDFENVHCCGILAAQNRASQDKYFDIENAAADLLAVIERASKKIKRAQ